MGHANSSKSFWPSLVLAHALAACSEGAGGAASGGPTAEPTTEVTTAAASSSGASSDASTAAATNTTTGAGGSSGATGGSSGSGGSSSTGDASGSSGSSGPSEPVCEDLVLGGPFTVAPETPNFSFPLPMTPGVAYSRLEVRFTFDPADWGGMCYNPYYNPPKLVPVFHQFMTLRRGEHWCKGGNLGEFALAGPDKNRLIAEVYYHDPPWEGPGCGPEIVPFEIFGGEHTVLPVQGQANPVELVYDAAGGAISMAIAGEVFEGAPHPDAALLATESHPIVLNFSFSESNECYDAEGNPSDQAVCCHAPSFGWTFDAIEVRLCK